MFPLCSIEDIHTLSPLTPTRTHGGCDAETVQKTPIQGSKASETKAKEEITFPEPIPN